MKSIVGILVWYQCIIQIKWSLCGSVSRGDYNEVQLFRTPAAYDVETMVLLNDLTKKDKEVGYKIKATLHVAPVWSHSNSEFLLKFTLLQPQLHLRGKHINADFRRFDSIWDSHQESDFYVHWKSGTINNSYLDASDPVDILNYKKSLISLFQFQIIDGEYKETDISGTCNVSYESVSTEVFRKTKSGCVEAEAGAEAEAEAGAGAEAEAEGAVWRRVARYTLGAAPALRDVYADEVVQLGDAALGVKARSWQRLQAAGDAHAAPLHAALGAALAALPPRLKPAALALATDQPEDHVMTLAEAVRGADAAAALRGEAAGAGGGAAAARGALRLLPALRAARPHQLAELLNHPDNYHSLSGLCRLLGLAGTQAAYAAVDALVQLGARDALEPLGLAYLGALALAPAPEPGAVAAAAALAGSARSPRLAGAALLGAAAAAARLPGGGGVAARELRERAARELARCRDDACRALRLQALGLLRREDGTELLLEHAERGGRAPALAALDALAALPPRALHYARRRRLEALALQHGKPLEVRAAALELLVQRSAARPLPLASTARALHQHGPLELRRLFWQRLLALADDHPDVRQLVDALPIDLKSWHAQAHKGTSLALRREPGWALGGWRAQLDTLQAAAGGLLRRGRVALAALGARNESAELLAVELWTRGLHALAPGAEPDPALYEADAEADAEVAGGLGFSVAGVAMPPVDLFTGQAELLAQVWAGAGSSATPALRALAAAGRAWRRLPLLGGALAAGERRGALALALDAQAQVSLWARSARAALTLRAGAAARAELRVRTRWARLLARADLSAEPRLHIAADLDFYDAVALCVRVSTDHHHVNESRWLESAAGSGRGLRVRRARSGSAPAPGRTLALARASHAACRALPPADD